MLSRIVAEKEKRLSIQKSSVPLAELKAMVKDAGPLRSFAAALQQPGVSLIAEIKFASPSKGNFGLTGSAAELAEKYSQGGADAISVLTETDFFHGRNQYVTDVRRQVALPVLRKDFIIDAYQLYESRLLCADAVLLIVRLLNKDTLIAFYELATELGMDVLVETHNEVELELALASGAKIIGINNRNLETFTTNIEQTLRLAPQIPPGVIKVSESGIHNSDDLSLVATAGVDAVLIGEALVTAVDPIRKIHELRKGTYK